MASRRVMASILLSLSLSLSLDSALIDPAFALQVADGQYSGSYNGVDLDAAQVSFNGVRARGGGGGAPLGAIIAVPTHAVAKFLENELEAWLPCDGVSTAGTALETLMTLTPNLNGTDGKPKRFLQGTTETETSGMVEAGLPNITGNVGHIAESFGSAGYANGAFQKFGASDRYTPDNPNTSPTGGFSFNASRCSLVYRDDVTTVQPAAYTVRYYIRCNE